MILVQTRDGWFRPVAPTSKEDQIQVDRELRRRLGKESELYKFLKLDEEPTSFIGGWWDYIIGKIR